MTTIINYDVTEAALNALREKQALVLVENPIIEDVKAAKREVAKLRNAIEKHRLKLNVDAQAHIKNVNTKAKEAQAPVAEIEGKYDAVIDAHDAAIAKAHAEAKEKEAVRISTIEQRIQNIYKSKMLSPNCNSAQIKSEIESLNWFLGYTPNFDYAEFKEKADYAIFDAQSYLESILKLAIEREEKEVALETQRKIDEENRLKFEAEKTAFEDEKRAANEKLEAERAALQKEIDIKERAEKDRLFAEQEKARLAEFERQQAELEKQRAIDAEKRKAMEEAELLRIEEVEKENEARKLAQEKEDKIRNAAKDMLIVLYHVLESEMAMREEDEGRMSSILNEVRAVIKSAEGN